MSFRQIRVYYFNFVRDGTGISGLVSNNTVDPGFPLDFLIDNRNTTKMKFASAESDHWINIDLGSGHTESVNHLIIPAGHNLNGEDIDLFSGASPSPTTPTRISGPVTIATDGVISISFSGQTHRYWRLDFQTSGAHELPQFILSQQYTFDAGPNMRRAEDSFRHSFQRFEQPSGITPTLERGVRRRIMEVIFERVQGDDLAAIEEWIATVGMHHPFWIDPWSFSATPDADDPTAPFKFDDQPEALMGVAVPNTEIETKRYELPLIQSND